MAQLDSSTNKFSKTFTLTKQNNTIYTLQTANKYIQKDIELTMNVRSASATLSGSAAATISSLNYTYNSSSGKFDVTGTASISGTGTVSVSQAGWIGSNVSGSITGTATAVTAIPKVGVKATLGGTTTGLKPTINRTTTSATGATNVGTNDATTTAPTSGYFISVQSATNVAAITATAAVSSAGYGTTTSGQYSPTHASTTVGANASDITYIPIKAGSVTISGSISQAPTISVCATNGLITAAYSTSKNFTPSVTSGWIEAGTQGSISASGSNTNQLTTKAAATYYPSSSDQTIAASQWLTGAQTIKGVTTANITAGNVRSGVTVTVGDSTSASRVLSVAGTFTAANTVSSGQTAAAAGQILSGYSAWVNGAEVKGNIPAKGNSNINAQTSTVYVEPGYYATTASTAVKAGAVNTPATTIAKAPTISIATATGVITAKYNSSKSVTPNVSTAGWISSGTAGTISTTGNNTLTLDPPSISVSGKTITINPGWVCSTTAYNVQTTSMTYTLTSVSSNNAVTRGNASWGTGWITTGQLNAATFANSPTADVTYVDISNTNHAPVLTAEGNLYIDQGYTDNLVISLAKLIPDTANVSASNQMLNGVTAFDKNGKLWTGNIPTKTGSDLSASGKTVTVPAGYYASQYTKNVADGSATTPGTTITQAPTISVSSNGYVIANYSKTQSVTPTVVAGYVSAGTAGNITANGTATHNLGQSGLSATSITPGAQQTVYVTPGYRAATATVTVKAASEGTAATITYSGGGLTAANKEFTPTVDIGAGSNTNMENITIGAADTATYAYFFRVYATATSGTMYPTVTRADYKDTRTAGYLAARSATTVLSAATCTATAVAKAANAGNTTYVSIKAASLNASGAVATTAVVAISGTTNMATATSGVYYFNTASTITNGKATVKYSSSAGYTPATTASQDVTVNTACTGTGKVYIPTSSYTISSISGGGVSCAIKSTTSCTATTTDSYNSGVAIQFTGSRAQASVSTTATEGYMPASNKTATLSASSANSSVYYLQSVTLTPPPASTTRTFDIIVPNGNTTDYITFQFTVDSAGNVTVAGP